MRKAELIIFLFFLKSCARGVKVDDEPPDQVEWPRGGTSGTTESLKCYVRLICVHLALSLWL